MNRYNVDNINCFSNNRIEVRFIDSNSILHPMNNRHGIVYGEKVFDCMFRMYAYLRMLAITEESVEIMYGGRKYSVSRDEAMRNILEKSYVMLYSECIEFIEKTWLGDDIEFEVMQAVCMYKILQHEDVMFELVNNTHSIDIVKGDSKTLMSSGCIVRSDKTIHVEGKNMFGFAMMKAFDFINDRFVKVENIRKIWPAKKIVLQCEKRFESLLTVCAKILTIGLLRMKCFARGITSDCWNEMVIIYFTINIDSRSIRKLTDILLEMPTMKLPDFKA